MTHFKNIIRPIAFLIGLFILINGVAYLLTPKDNIDEGVYGQAEGILSEPDNTIDYLSIGDSECYTSISPMEIWHKYGYVGYNCGVTLQKLQDTYYLLEEILKNQSPKVVLLETNAIYQTSDFYNEFQKALDGVLAKKLAIFKYHNNWKSITFDRHKGFKLDPKRISSDPYKGFHYKPKAAAYTKGYYVKETQETKEIEEIPLFYLNKIANLCKERDIQLVLYCAPSPICWSYAKHNGVAAYAEENELPFIDFNLHTDELGIDWTKDTCDNGDHMNYAGAKKVTKYIGEYLYAHCDLPNHSEDSKYAAWNESLNEYLKLTSQTK